MALWLANLAAYSVQLAVLVGTALLVLALLGVSAPAGTLRFWQLVFVSSVAWPAYQLWASAMATSTGAQTWNAVASSGGFWVAAAATAGGLQIGISGLSNTALSAALLALAVGAAIRLMWLALGIMKLRRVRAASEDADVLAPIARPLQQVLGVVADVRFSDAVDSPATIGVRHPAVLLPPSVRALPESVQRALLCHELIHVRRRDWLWTMLEEIWCAIFWFHPAARILASRLGLAREMLVDEATIAHTKDRRAYALALLEFSTTPTRLAGATALIGRRHLARRIALLAQEVSMTRSAVLSRVAVALVAVTVVTLAASSTVPLRASAQQPERVYKSAEDEGVTLPVLIREVKPRYTAAAMQAKIQGTVLVTAVVLATGDVGKVEILESLDAEHGLDQEAVEATRQWKFKPGTKDGKPVPVEVTIEMTFTLKK